jgi:hypothetical protein
MLHARAFFVILDAYFYELENFLPLYLGLGNPLLIKDKSEFKPNLLSVQTLFVCPFLLDSSLVEWLSRGGQNGRRARPPREKKGGREKG